MKRTIVTIMLACATLFMTQCKKADIKSVVPQEWEMVDVTLKVDTPAKTEIDGLTVKWKIGDKLYVVGASEGLLGFISAQNTGTTAYFTGSIKKTSSNQKFHYYYVGKNTFVPDVNNGTWTFSVTEQNGLLNSDNTYDGITDKFHLMHGESSGEIEVGQTNLDAITMKNMIAIAHMNFSKTDNSEFTRYIVCKGGYASATLNTKTGLFSAKTSGPILLENVGVNNFNDYYIALIPGDKLANDPQTFTFAQGLYSLTLAPKDIEENLLYNKKDIEMVASVAVPGLFSVSGSKQVQFSKGNLQYRANQETWRFAEHQWNYVGGVSASLGGIAAGNVEGSSNTYISSTNSNWIDLFGLGCTGKPDKRASIPYANDYHYFAYSYESVGNTWHYGPYNGNSLSVDNDSDWGCIETLPGNTNDKKMWYTLSGTNNVNGQWYYIMNSRSTQLTLGTTNNSRFSSVKVNGALGLMLFPDDFVWPDYVTKKPTAGNSAYWTSCGSVEFNIDEFALLESEGVVFLPAGGYRAGQGMGYPNQYGYYWSNTVVQTTNGNAYRMKFDNNGLVFESVTGYNGCSVRLVRDPIYDGNGGANPLEPEPW